MPAYTTTDKLLLEPTTIDELVMSINERRAAAIASGATGLPAALERTENNLWYLQGTPSQKPLFLLMQEMVEALVPWYVDYEDSTPGTAFTTVTFRTRAGLHASGWRRTQEYPFPNAPTFSYGKIQDGDILQYWIIDDIVAALYVLRWTFSTNVTAQDYEHVHLVLDTGKTDYSDAVADIDAAWSALSFHSTGATDPRSFSSLVEWDVDRWAGRVSQTRAKLKFSISAAPFSGSALFCFAPTDALSGFYFDPDGVAQGTWTAAGECTFAADDTTGVSDTWTFAGKIANPTATIQAAHGDTDEKWSSAVIDSYSDWQTKVVLKWDFTLDFEA